MNRRNTRKLDKMTLFLEKNLLPVAGKVAGQKHLSSIRDGILMAMPMLIIGSVFLILGFLPIPGYSEFMTKIFGSNWLEKVTLPVGATFNLMAIFANLGISYRLCENYKVDPLLGAMISLAAFILISPNTIEVGGNTIGEVIPVALMGGRGLFVSMIVALSSTEIYRIFIQKKLTIKLPLSVPPTVGKSFGALIPGIVVITIVWIINLAIASTSFENIHYVVSKMLMGPITAIGSSYIGIITLVLLANLLWICGIHGANIIYGISAPMLYTLMDQNIQAFRAGQEIPNITSQNLIDIFVSVGGSGGTLGLVILMVWKAKSSHLKELGKLSIVPGIFNINEPIIFGTPIVMNPVLVIPFLVSPLIGVSLTYWSMKLGIVAKLPGIAVPWTSPAGIGAFVASSGHVSAAVMQLVIVPIQMLIWYPFFRIIDREKMTEENQVKNIE